MRKREVEILILGQGFAGTALGFLCKKRKVSFCILADSSVDSASKSAVGLVNPVTGRRMAKTWNCDILMPLTLQFYKEAFQLIFPDENSNDSFFASFPIFKALHSSEEINQLEARSAWPEFHSYLSMTKDSEVKWPAIFTGTQAWCQIDQGGRLKTESYLDVSKSWFRGNEEMIEENFEIGKLGFQDGWWQYENLKSRYVVSCLGIACPWVGKELIPVKGQALEISGLPHFGNRVLKTDKFFIPNGKGNHLCGSTYEKQFHSEDPDEQGKNEILDGLIENLRSQVKIERHWAGIRPTTHSRKPIIKKISEGLYSLNGLGTKGVSISPWAASELLNLIFEDKNPKNK